MERRGEQSPKPRGASCADRLPQNSPKPCGSELLFCTRSLCARGTPLGGNRCDQPDNVQTYFVIAGDVTRCLQPPQVVFALVVRAQVWVMQAVVLCAHQVTVGISQVKIA